MIKREKIKDLLVSTAFDTEVKVMGWVRTFRNNQFIALNDGSCMGNIQIVVDFTNTPEELLKRITTGAAIAVEGTLVESLGKGQKVDVKAKNIEILGDSDQTYPIQPKKHSLEFLRDYAYLRFRTNTFNAIFKVRHTLAFAIHQFFNERGFVYMNTPIITASDAEGAGEMFRVTTLPFKNPPLTNEQLDIACNEFYNNILKTSNAEDKIAKLNAHLRDFCKKNSSGDLKEIAKDLSFQSIVCANDAKLRKLKKLWADMWQSGINDLFSEIYKSLVDSLYTTDNEGIEHYGNGFKELNKTKKQTKITRRFSKENYPYLALSYYNFYTIDGRLKKHVNSKQDFSEDFFGKATNLTVSGQLEGELAAMAFGQIYTFGPTFRAENSNTTRHLAEFWMIEPEVAFADLENNMELAEDMMKYVISYALENCKDEIAFLNDRLLEEEKTKPQQERSELSLIEKLDFCLANEFERLTYTEAIQILKHSKPNQKKQFKYLIDEWGADLQSEHERYLVEKHFKKPVILTDYPKDIKSFYMRMNDDGKTVAAMDILFPGIGEMIGGSQREEREGHLKQRMKDLNIDEKELKWYLATRQYGSAPHAGFGLGFERLVLFVTGMTNIRDVIAFPRFPKSAEF